MPHLDSRGENAGDQRAAMKLHLDIPSGFHLRGGTHHATGVEVVAERVPSLKGLQGVQRREGPSVPDQLQPMHLGLSERGCPKAAAQSADAVPRRLDGLVRRVGEQHLAASFDLLTPALEVEPRKGGYRGADLAHAGAVRP